MQPINISEEKLPPFGHSPAHLRMINALPDNGSPSMNGVHRGSITMSDKDGFSPASSVNGDGASGSHHSGPNHGASSSSSSASSASSASLPNSVAINGSFGVTGPGPTPGVVMARPGLRTFGSSENFARRIRSSSMLRRTEEQENMSKGTFQPSRPPQATGAPSGQQQPMQHYQQQQHQHQQQQYSYNHEPGSSDISRYRRASSPRRRSISMTNLNGLSVIMIPPKKVSERSKKKKKKKKKNILGFLGVLCCSALGANLHWCELCMIQVLMVISFLLYFFGTFFYPVGLG
jgi:hypothetical protein